MYGHFVKKAGNIPVLDNLGMLNPKNNVAKLYFKVIWVNFIFENMAAKWTIFGLKMYRKWALCSFRGEKVGPRLRETNIYGLDKRRIHTFIIKVY